MTRAEKIELLLYRFGATDADLSVKEIAEALDAELKTDEPDEHTFQSLPFEWATIGIIGNEGEEWVPFKRGQTQFMGRVHAIKFANGRIWDTYNGWRN